MSILTADFKNLTKRVVSGTILDGRKNFFNIQDEKKNGYETIFFSKPFFFSKNQDFFGGFLETPKKPSGDPPGPSLGPQNAWKRSKNRQNFRKT